MDSSRSRMQSSLEKLKILATLAIALLFAAGPSLAADPEWADNVWDALTQGKPTLNFRARFELADTESATQSEAYTFRTRLGYGTKPYEGISLYADFENVAAIAESQYFSGVGTNTSGKTTIADPTATELNQVYMKISREDLLHSTAIGGRQRIILDDHRFVGNVGWRQNEQTYDAALLDTSLGVENLQIIYGYLGRVHRIFSNQSPQFDWRSNSHLVNVSYSGIKALKITAFAYLLDFRTDSAGNSSQTYGARGSGKHAFNDDWSIGYTLSYAYQMDYADNAADYGAHYALADLSVANSSLGSLGAAYEMLGSDDGKGRVVTPLATLHAWNGWADVFLTNGGNDGLRDVQGYVAPKLPWQLNGKLVYHYFRSDNNGRTLGHEFDALLGRPVNKHLDLLTKVAYFDGTGGTGIADTVRFWVEATVKF